MLAPTVQPGGFLLIHVLRPIAMGTQEAPNRRFFPSSGLPSPNTNDKLLIPSTKTISCSGQHSLDATIRLQFNDQPH
jgi:hypothetical protein